MKSIIKLTLVSLLFLQALSTLSQSEPVTTEIAPAIANTAINQNSFLISPRIGYDFPFFQNNTPFIDYKGGIDLGISLDYYWNWFGIGADFDYIRNKPESTYDYENLYGSAGLITSTDLTEVKITRTFTGIGPDFRWQNKTGKLTAELNTRVGLGSIRRGSVTQKGLPGNDMLNYHAGYDIRPGLASKLQTKATYFFNEKFGVNAGLYYIQHYNSKELVGNNYAAAYQPIITVQSDIKDFDGALQTRTEACNCNIFSIGVFAGITYKIPTKPKVKKEEKCDICDTYSLTVTARDKFTNQILPNTDIAVKNLEGEIVETGTTNSYGVVVFNGIKPNNYTIEGVLHEVNLDANSITKGEFKKNETIQKEVIYSNEEFILEGNAVVCNTTEGIPGVKVKLINNTEGIQKNSVTDEKGIYILHVKKNKTYTLSGKKDNYFSQKETINTADFDRNTTLFIKLEICMEKADCGKSLKLQNIEYDLDKYFIRNEAKIELNRLVEFMNDNPTLKVELSSHTDSRGSDSYNMTLSQNRADAAVDYVVSQGIDRARLSGKGFGETRLLNECSNGVSCTKAQHQINRRTEMKVICPD